MLPSRRAVAPVFKVSPAVALIRWYRGCLVLLVVKLTGSSELLRGEPGLILGAVDCLLGMPVPDLSSDSCALESLTNASIG